MDTSNIILENIYRDFSQRLRAFIRRRISDDQIVEDLLQVIFLKIHQGLGQLENHRKLENWIYRIARNTVIDYYRSRKPTGAATDELSDETTEPFEDVKCQLAPALKDMILSLPQPYRQALILTVFEGLSQKQLAEKLGISISGAKSRVQRARKMLRKLLEDCCHFEFDRLGRLIDYQPKCQRCYHDVPRWGSESQSS